MPRITQDFARRLMSLNPSTLFPEGASGYSLRAPLTTGQRKRGAQLCRERRSTDE